MNSKRILLLNGSMRKNGTSVSIANTLKRQIETKGHQAEIVHIMDYYDRKYSIKHLKDLISQYNTIGIVAPCYVNTLPYADIWCFERLVEEFEDKWQGKGFFAIAQGGMPDNEVHQSILDVCSHFAKEVKMEWLGGLIIGLAPIINGAPLESTRFIGKRLIKPFDKMLEELLNDERVSNALQRRITLNLPKVLNYPLAFLLNQFIKSTIKKAGTVDPYRKPYK
ncbi:NAD(P)H-dependent oxidoreductase [Cellulosilyticum sp. I15G10I2]|uniref:NAD(P)H-dependent oxidoreductase n=1 Tax=Cellulosilyticum sp. I15G10I2 TaxID=1892843 RepID=UPI00085BBE4B|nr:NAD(P)H-dependent oxidoreductase [Cellulosilyticum sp. I15G10I2]